MDAIATGTEGLEQPSPDDVRAELQRILESRDFTPREQRRKFLRYVVEEALAGRSRSLKGVAIAMSVFDRDETFDQQIDPIVRLEARRLRRDLDSYYATAGRNDPVRISIPKGGYVPLFEKQRSAGQADAEGLLALPKGPLIAVLPFLHLSGNAERQYVSDGMTEQITTDLARFHDLWVLPLGSVQQYKAGLADPRELHREFGANYGLEGSVLEIDNTIRISARLIDVENARYIWAQTYDATFTPANIYEVQDAITKEVVGNLAGKYGVLAQKDMARAKRKAPDSLDAYDCVLRYYDYQKSMDAGKHAEVKANLERAVALAPEYAEAWAVLANVYTQEIRFRLGRPAALKDAMAKAKSAAKRAIDLDPADPTGYLMHSSLLHCHGDLVGFKQPGETALRLNPNNANTLARYGGLLAFSGDWDRGMPLVRKAIALNPAHPHWYLFPEVLYQYDRGAFQQTLAELDKIDMPNFIWSHVFRVASLGQLARLEEATAAMNDLLTLRPAFLQEASSLIDVLQFPRPLRQSIVEGLRKAGLEID